VYKKDTFFNRQTQLLRKKTISTTGLLIAFAGAVLFSTKAVIVKKAFADIHIDALTLLALRMICSLPFYIAVAMFVQNKESNTKLSSKQWWHIFILGLFGYYLSSFLDFEGLQYVSAGLERLILFLFPTFVVLINRYYFHQPVSKRQLAAIILTYAGIAIAFVAELKMDVARPGFLLGCLLIFLCAITYSIYIAGSGKIIPSVGAAKFTAYAMLAATVGVLTHFIIAANKEFILHADEKVWLYGLLIAVVATVIPSFLVSLGMKKIGSNNAAIVASIGPVSTILQAHYVLGEPISIAQLAGTLLVIAGILLIGWKAGREAN
jgi:drug/metabolite transporter (DMT)-like permease